MTSHVTAVFRFIDGFLTISKHVSPYIYISKLYLLVLNRDKSRLECTFIVSLSVNRGTL